VRSVDIDMSFDATDSIFEHLGVRPVINGRGIYTDLGGCRLSPRVWHAMEQMNGSFVDLPMLLDQAGQHIADLFGAPAGIVTPGVAAAIMLGSAAAIAGTDGEISARLPDVRGLKNRVLIQSGHRYDYDRQVSLSGATLVEVGDHDAAHAQQLEAAIDERTAMMLYPAHLESRAGSLSIREAAEITRRHGVVLFVDAAFMNYPTNVLTKFIQAGADLVAVSAKYYGGPNSGGFVIGRASLIEAVRNVYFTHYESSGYRKFGRPLKMDRHIVVAVVVALEEWLSRDHEERFQSWRRRAEIIRSAVDGAAQLNAKTMGFDMKLQLVAEPVNCVVIDFTSSKLTARDLARELADDDPQVLTIAHADMLIVAVNEMTDDEARYVAQRILAIADQHK
jgi:D-glucosaminate-6-phosphate ammonia-lyase